MCTEEKNLSIKLNTIYNPDAIKKLHNLIQNRKSSKISFTGAKPKKFQLALLKAAYLEGFYYFGYEFLLDSNIQRVREQLINPGKNISQTPVILKGEFSEEKSGIHFVKSPEDYWAFLIIFRLKHKNYNKVFAVILPGPGEKAWETYMNYSNINGKIDFETDQMSTENLKNSLTDPKFILRYNCIWKHYTRN